MYILAGDVGGTKTVLALYRRTAEEEWSLHSRKQFASADYAEFEQLLNTFMAEQGDVSLAAACVGVAGPIIDGDCRTTNLPWELKSADIATRLQIPKIKLLNDLEAAAYGVLYDSSETWADLNPRAVHGKTGNIAVIAAGTGLGEAILYWDGQRHHIIATEGGHTDFAPNTDRQDALLQYLRAQLPGHVSYERVASGEGLKNVYRFLKDSGFAEESAEVGVQMQQRDPSAVIGELGVRQEDALCTEALRLFCAVYGAEAGNLALKCLPYAGVFLAGGIAAKILPALQRGDFLQAFLDKGRFAPILSDIPVKVCLNPDLALFGAAKFAAEALI